MIHTDGTPTIAHKASDAILSEAAVLRHGLGGSGAAAALEDEFRALGATISAELEALEETDIEEALAGNSDHSRKVSELEVTEAVYDFAAWRVLVNLRTQWTEDILAGKLTDLSDAIDRLIILERVYAENVRKHG